MKQDIDIFELVLAFYRSPSKYPDLLDPLKPLPEGITDLLELTAGEVEARSNILTRAAASTSPSELVDATSYFSEQVLFVPGGDHYRVLGLNHDASVDDIREHYELIVRLFYQDNEDNAIQSNEAGFSQLNLAYKILRDDKKCIEYDRSLETQGRLQRPINKEEINEIESIPHATTANVQAIGSYREKNSITDSSAPISDTPIFNEDRRPEKSEPVKTSRTSSAVVNGRLPKILIVDDSATVRAGLYLALSKEFECITAKDGEKGWKKLQEMNDILLVLTDLEMPVLNGYEFTKRIRENADKRINSLPVIVVTGTNNVDAKQKAIAAGADDFLAKSTDYIEVLTRVKVHYRWVKTNQQLNKSQAKSEQKFSSERSSDNAAHSNIADGVPVFSVDNIGFKNIITIGAFGVVTIVLITLLYLSQIKPTGDTTVVNIQDEPRDADTLDSVDALLSTQISRDTKAVSDILEDAMIEPEYPIVTIDEENFSQVENTKQVKNISDPVNPSIVKPVVKTVF